MAEKVTRDAFLYMDPSGPEPGAFAQCGTCRFRLPTPKGMTCILHTKDMLIDDDDSCGLYVQGPPHDAEDAAHYGCLTPEQSGFVSRQVRCENCRFFDPDDGDCELFEMLNKRSPDVFDLDEKVDEHGCCNAQTPIGSDGRVGETLEKFSR